MKEREFIEKIRNQFASIFQQDLLEKGIGDDCAVFGESDEFSWLVTTDLLVDSVHFKREWHDAYLLGRKSMAVNLSDIAAMGGDPRFALISLALPSSINDAWVEQWHKGIEDMLRESNCVLIGGDTAKSPTLTINVVIIGSAHPANILYRSGAKCGQDVYVTGALGLSAAGLELLSRGMESDKQYRKLLTAHLDPQPQLQAGKLLGESGLVSAMQDISDGLATDLSHICKESNIGAVIFTNKLPHDAELKHFCTKCQLDAVDLMLLGGEDYELVFTAEPANRVELELLSKKLAKPFYRVGSILKDGSNSVYLESEGLRKAITFGGFEHTT